MAMLCRWLETIKVIVHGEGLCAFAGERYGIPPFTALMHDDGFHCLRVLSRLTVAATRPCISRVPISHLFACSLFKLADRDEARARGLGAVALRTAGRRWAAGHVAA